MSTLRSHTPTFAIGSCIRLRSSCLISSSFFRLRGAVRNAPDFESAQTVFRTGVLEAQKGERLRFPLSTLFPVLPGVASEPDQLGLVFVQFQSVLRQPFL